MAGWVASRPAPAYFVVMAGEAGGKDGERARRRTAREPLGVLRREAGSMFDSSLAAAARRAADHFSAADTETTAEGRTDRIELWGRRIGRGLSLAALIGLAIYLYLTYLR